jgi:2'-hydroxybiphenyl-2-sulfinate desulfinase
VLLQSLPQEQWHVHFDYQDNYLFREGGNIPPLWSRSNGAENVLIGLTFLLQKAYILVRIDSNIDSVEELRGKKLGIPLFNDLKRVDFARATAWEGLEYALAARGVSTKEVSFVDLVYSEAELAKRGGWNTKPSPEDLARADIEPLDSGKADALYVWGARAQRYLLSGKYKAIFENTAHPDQLLPLDNHYPNVLTVSRRLAGEAPEIVVEYVKQILLAAEWAKTHLSQTLELLGRQTHSTPGEMNLAQPVNFHKKLHTVITREGLFALESQKRFLFDHGFITRDFDIEKWADGSFIKAAWEEIHL